VIMKVQFAALLLVLAAFRSHSAEEPKVFVAPTPVAPAPVPATTQAAAPSLAPAAAPAPPPSAPAKLAASELEKLAMPIALHPDALISVILPASVYPVEIVQAARFVKDTNNIPKVDEQPWDANVKAVAKFPELIAKMDADLGWTVKLGQAFLDQPKELMDVIQDLRAKAQKAGTLRTTPQQIVTVTNIIVLETNYTQVVTVTNQIVQVAPANPQVVYVPSYPPTVYYPPPTYVYDPVTPLVTFGIGMMWGAAIANNHCDWHYGGVYNDIDIDVDRTVNRGDRTVNRGDRVNTQGNRAANTGARPTQQKWQPDQSRLRSSGAPSAATREARGWGGASTRPTTGARPSASTGMAGARPSTGSVGGRPSAGAPSVNRPSASANVGRPSSSPNIARSTSASSASRDWGGSGGSAFGGMNSGSSTRDFSNRGAASRSGSFGGGGGGFGGGRGGGGRRR
jgi:hypothetical protein